MNPRPPTPRNTPRRREIPIQFQSAGRIHRFDPGTLELRAGDRVVVEVERGTALGSVVAPARFRRSSKGSPLPRVVKRADSRDLLRDDRKCREQKATHRTCVTMIRDRNLPLKLVRTEHVLDGTKAVFYVTSEDDKIDTRDLARDVADQLQMRVEMKKVGARDETKVTGGVGPCGRELCCSSWLREFAPISVKMAKEQDLALNHSRLAGMCGRLKCCLRYEYETYAALKKGLPRVGRKVESVKGSGEVVRQNVLKQTVVLRAEDEGAEVEVSLEDLVERRRDV